jgi:hypothetical protein
MKFRLMTKKKKTFKWRCVEFDFCVFRPFIQRYIRNLFDVNSTQYIPDTYINQIFSDDAKKKEIN